jgi:CBS domain-containing protein
MTVRVHVANALTPFKLLARLIDENRVSAIPIVDQQGVPIGIVSETDLQHTAMAEGSVASEVMTSPAITVTPGASLSDATRLMQEKDLGRLVVVDDRGRIAGIVSRGDLLHVLELSRNRRYKALPTRRAI